MDNSELARLKKRVGKESTVPAAPSFYDEDLSKFAGKTQNLPKGEKYKNVDFVMSGNPNELRHLIQKHSNGSPTRSEINFGFGLRRYKSTSNFEKNNVWKFPGIRGAKESMAAPASFIFSPQDNK